MGAAAPEAAARPSVPRQLWAGTTVSSQLRGVWCSRLEAEEAGDTGRAASAVLRRVLGSRPHLGQGAARGPLHPPVSPGQRVPGWRTGQGLAGWRALCGWDRAQADLGLGVPCTGAPPSLCASWWQDSPNKCPQRTKQTLGSEVAS